MQDTQRFRPVEPCGRSFCRDAVATWSSDWPTLCMGSSHSRGTGVVMAILAQESITLTSDEQDA